MHLYKDRLILPSAVCQYVMSSIPALSLVVSLTDNFSCTPLYFMEMDAVLIMWKGEYKGNQLLSE